ncbi:hypothetical protein NXH56_09425, partial [Bifidobacterium thermophilum]|nr:hypothetical protein [Bifidobacterium thermophilum]
EYNKALDYDIVGDFRKPKNDDALENYPYLTNEIQERAKELLAGILAEQDGYEEKDLTGELAEEYKTLADR